MLTTFHIHITGQVQGVGFRPFVWRLAQAHGLRGWVNNTTDGVHIVFNAESPDAFLEALVQQAPALARITGIRCEPIWYQEFTDFQIAHSASDAPPNLLIAPDFALCPDCRRELNDPTDRRFGYAFITCTNCGPRYSILTALPYDRERTAMALFEQCPTCQAEFDNPADRRYFSQTNSCPDCGIQLAFRDAAGTDWPEPLDTAVAWLRQGRIVAVKGIGGYLLLCDASHAAAIRTLRRRKHRPTKPFALLYPSAEALEADVLLRPVEADLLQGHIAPIVLLEMRDNPPSGICTDDLAPGLSHLGAMLPSAPLLELLARQFGRPLVATSGNASGSPIAFRDADALRDLAVIADGFLMHNRAIAVPQDDSVFRFGREHGRRMVVRRSRGLAPTAPPPTQSFDHWSLNLENWSFSTKKMFNVQGSMTNVPVERVGPLALGASLKSTFAWQHRQNTYLSQYLGDLESFDTQQHFEHTLQHFLTLFRDRPEAVLVDKHPDYFSTHLGHRLAEEWQVPVVAVQHHRAHVAAVLAENSLLDATEPVLGVVWDGTGYGDDGQIWGGEFFRWQDGRMDRVGHLEYFDVLAGDKMPREPRLSALSLTREWPDALENRFSSTEWSLYRRMLARGGLLQTSSMGRVFDGVASLLGLADKVSYEGEAAMLVEAAAFRYFRLHDLRATPQVLEVLWENGEVVPVRALVAQVHARCLSTNSVEYAAAFFHVQLIALLAAAARRYGCRAVACSGGVWQNAVLVDLAEEWLRPEFDLYFHREMSPNDECVAYGQLAYHLSKCAATAHPSAY